MAILGEFLSFRVVVLSAVAYSVMVCCRRFAAIIGVRLSGGLLPGLPEPIGVGRELLSGFSICWRMRVTCGVMVMFLRVRVSQFLQRVRPGASFFPQHGHWLSLTLALL